MLDRFQDKKIEGSSDAKFSSLILFRCSQVLLVILIPDRQSLAAIFQEYPEDLPTFQL